MLKYKLLLFVLVSMITVSCKKGWIEIKSNKSLDTPNTVEDFQALLDYTTNMNENRPSIGEVSADNYYVPYTSWQTWTPYNKSAYMWNADIYNNSTTDNVNWNYSYRQVFYSNIVLDGIDDVESIRKSTMEWNNVKGSALYFRGEAFFNVSQIYTRPYSLTFPDNAGIPLRLNADPNDKSVRASLKDTYQQIVQDLKGSLNYLPDVPVYKQRPSKPAAYALLSRIYLVMQDYPNALMYADSCLKKVDSILDYNTLKSTVNFPIPGLNKEVIFQATISDDLQGLLGVNCIVDSTLYKSYDNNDLRKTLFYKAGSPGQMNFIGTYTGGTASTTSKAFGGIATDEVYLTRAECYARTGNVAAAMSDLNKLMIARWKTGTFVPFTAAGATDALAIILRERRKETPFRGLRWLDLRRLNSEGDNITLTRTVNGQQYSLPPNDLRYALSIPPDVISLSGMTQNDR
ncbi:MULTISPECIES: RagB/SusD family nutrient uptake outer membrane protein [Niastella]|uniref:RagB/SusD family nutrient uptake outer membrane protein n=1 Tax=Niastella soli TaxID=2821487 RepID=A0ABS3YYF8_9BACT|nr:RagB/SusD family nutrient uptake outer membrane protein [Niastella soli]MBO9202951.1 RagB/SusD family nutrient uptake outer membrane protein [Niastella soli]